jgi:hypothetical protein
MQATRIGGILTSTKLLAPVVSGLIIVCIALGAKPAAAEPQPKVKDAIADRFGWHDPSRIRSSAFPSTVPVN